eukprot:1586158-Heterocapsa_arctica.AAC.1
MYLKRADYEEHGYTKGCAGRGAWCKGWRHTRHTAACRTHMETLLAATPSGVFRMRQYDDRINAH